MIDGHLSGFELHTLRRCWPATVLRLRWALASLNDKHRHAVGGPTKGGFMRSIFRLFGLLAFAAAVVPAWAQIDPQPLRIVLAGELRSGQFVSQRELTSLLGATLNPVREAIRKLEAEGLINVYAQRGIQVIEAKPRRSTTPMNSGCCSN